ncbi:MAG TPA: pilus assembly protein PilM [Candidatus Paceibacterota bacterium]
MAHNNSFFKFFPPPALLRMSAVGLDIGNQFIRFVELVPKGDGLVLGRYGEEPTPRGSIIDGEIKDSRALEIALSKMRTRHNLSLVRASISEKLGYLFSAQIARVARREIRGALELRLEEFVPIAGGEAVFDYVTTDCPAPDDQKFWNIGVAVLPQTKAMQYVELLRGVGFTPLSFELEAHSLVHALLEKKDCGTVLIADIGATKTGVLVVSRGIVHLSASIAIGGESFTNAITKSLAIPFENAEALKRKHGLARRYGKGELFSVLAPLVSTLRDEIGRYANFWQTHEHGGREEGASQAIERIVLCGGEANTPGIREYLAQSLKMEVSLGNPWVNVVRDPLYVPELHAAHALRYTTAIGLALGDHAELV